MFSIPRPHRLAAGVLALAALAQAADYSSWSRYRDVTVNTDGLELTAPVKKIPLLVRFNAADHADMLNNVSTQISANGADVRVTKADGTTDVPFEIEQATTGANGSLVLWVLADSVGQNAANAAKFRVFWGKAGETSVSDPASVFDEANGYLAVWHMNGTDGEVNVAGDADLNAAATGTVPSANGVAGQARSFSTTDNYLSVPNSADGRLNLASETDYTLSAWVYSDSITTQNGYGHSIVNKGNNQYVLGIYGDADKHYDIMTRGTGWHNAPTNAAGNVLTAQSGEDTWRLVTGTWQGSGTPQDTARIYINGVLYNTTWFDDIANDASGRDLTRDVYIGVLYDNGIKRPHFGELDEVRISTVARDSNFIALEYATQRPDAPVVTIGTSQSQGGDAYADWTDSRDITLNTTPLGANVAEDVHNFPVLVRLGDDETNILTEAKANGDDIRFSRNGNALPYEIESWSATAAAIWVKVDLIEGNSADQKITIHWGKSDATSESDGTAVFAVEDDYVAVFHMNGTTNEIDATEHAFDATSFNDPTVDANPAIGGARHFDGTQHMQIIGSASSAMNFLADTTYSFSAWVRNDSIVPDGDNTGHLVISKGDFQWALAVFGASAPNRHYEVTTHVGNWAWRQTTTAPAGHYEGDYANGHVGEWRHMVGTWDGSPLTAATGRIYLDGELQKETVFNITSPVTEQVQTARDVHIGVLSNEGAGSTEPTGSLQRFWVGGLDEITVSSTVRSPAWIKLSYMNQKAVNALVNIGPAEFVAKAPGAPTAVTAVAGVGEATVSWTAPASNGGEAITEYAVKSVPDGKTCTSTTTSCTVEGLTNGTAYTFSVKATNSVGTGLASVASAPVTPAAPGWTAGRSITLNTSATGANIPGDVHNFPVLIRLGADEASILSAAKAGGADIRFLAEDSSTVIPHEIESWSATAAAIWVKVDVIKGNNATQKIHMLWGNEDAESTSNGPAVFDSANGYRAVWHMGGDAEEVNAVGIDTLNAAVTGDVPTKTGLIGDARSYANDIANYLSVPGSASGLLNFAPETDYSLSAWLYSEEVTPANLGILNKGNDQWLIGVYGGAEDKFYDIMTRGNGGWNQASTEAGDNTVTTADAIGVWRHVMGVWQGSGTPQDTGRIYINGNLVNTTFFDDITEGSDGRDTTTNVYIGVLWENGGLARPFFGLLDEVTASHTFRDSNWVKLTYESQKLTQKLTNIGVTEPGPATAPTAPRSVTAALGGTQGTVTVTWVAPANNGGAEITKYTVTGTPSGSCETTGALTCNVTGLAPGDYSFTVTATNSAGTSAASAAATVKVPVGLALPDAFAIHMDGARTPYTYRLPTGMIALTEMFSMTITDVQGKQVWTRTINPAGNKVGEITWNGTTLKGQPVAPGMYIVRLRAQMDGKTIEAVRGSIRK